MKDNFKCCKSKLIIKTKLINLVSLSNELQCTNIFYAQIINKLIFWTQLNFQDKMSSLCK